jgi:hypothetical protein
MERRSKAPEKARKQNFLLCQQLFCAVALLQTVSEPEQNDDL